MDTLVADVAIAGGPDPVPVVVQLRAPQRLERRGPAEQVVVDARRDRLRARDLADALAPLVAEAARPQDPAECAAAQVRGFQGEGLGTPDNLHPMQAAFIKHDGYQCGYCTPGQICSGVAVLDEIRAGIPSHVTADLTAPVQLSDAELRERMSGNICRCGAYSNIVEAMTEVAERQG